MTSQVSGAGSIRSAATSCCSLSLPVALSVSCSWSDAPYTRSSKLPPSPAVFCRLLLSPNVYNPSKFTPHAQPTESLKANLKQLIDSTDDGSINGSTDESTDNSTDEDESNDPTRRALAATGVKVDYTITVPVEDNAAIGDVDSVTVTITYRTNIYLSKDHIGQWSIHPDYPFKSPFSIHAHPPTHPPSTHRPPTAHPLRPLPNPTTTPPQSPRLAPTPSLPPFPTRPSSARALLTRVGRGDWRGLG